MSQGDNTHGSRSDELASSSVKDVVAEALGVGNAGIANLEAEDV